MFKKIMCSIKGHMWSNWNYREDNSCSQKRTCRRDGAVEERVAHSFGDWNYCKEGTCEQSSFCVRCKSRQDRVQHQYSQKAACGSFRVCDRCGNKERVEHVFRPTSQSQNATAKLNDSMHLPVSLTVYRCENCGKEENRVGMPR